MFERKLGMQPVMKQTCRHGQCAKVGQQLTAVGKGAPCTAQAGSQAAVHIYLAVVCQPLLPVAAPAWSALLCGIRQAI